VTTAVRVVTAAQAAARDRAAIEAGVPSRALMRQAGAAAAAEIARAGPLDGGVAVFAGPGNNGGDAWVVARSLAAAGVVVRVCEAAEARTPDARAERADALALLGGAPTEPDGSERVVVDGLLGTGAAGAPRGALADAVARVNARRDSGAEVVALDVPSGLDATTGRADGAFVRADVTLTFGTMKRGLLAARDACGRIAVLDIGLGGHAALADGAPALVDARWVAARVPPISAGAHKGTRRRVAIVGGGAGMAGATVLAARAAFRSGVGLVRLVVAPESVAAAQAAAPEAIAGAWPTPGEAAVALAAGGPLADTDALLVGPGLGRSLATRALVEALLRAWRGPVVLDADALNAFEGEADALGALLRGRPALVTPHPAEFARLAGGSVRDAVDGRYEAAPDLARRLGACVLLKGVPTVIAAPDGRCLVSAAGSPSLAVAGSGDLLSGICVTLLAQMDEPLDAAACAAWAHGRAAELAGGDAGRRVRGVTLDRVAESLGAAWTPPPPERFPVLCALPRVGEEGARP
jgi:NAD(P)H-hydrate epimerase